MTKCKSDFCPMKTNALIHSFPDQAISISLSDDMHFMYLNNGLVLDVLATETKIISCVPFWIKKGQKPKSC